MAEPISFPSSTEKLGLPLLFSGQAQKEFFLNQSLTIIDSLLCQSVEDTLDEPPADAQDGQCFIVSTSPSGDWAGHSSKIAVRIAESWHFVDPIDGLEVYDQAARQKRVFKTVWHQVSVPAQAQGGSVVDVEARAMLAELIAALRNVGIFTEMV
ncbi:MAG: DUF2793 domain-containing protein [Pseudomonadota bacterium]